MASASEIQKDLSELQKFYAESTRSRVKDFLSLHIHNLHGELLNCEEELKNTSSNVETPAAKSSSFTHSKTSIYTEVIKTYAWDQSDKFMKLYITLAEVQSVKKESIVCHFTEQSVKLDVYGLNQKNYELHIAKLCEKIVPEESYFKVKPDMVLVMLKKKVSKTWAWVTEQEKKAKEPHKPAVDEEDPSAGIMKLLQNMYEEGDDEMKRTISKAFYESQNKQGHTAI